MPQTAFAATGAGVKSSVLFLRKRSAIQSKAIEDLRQRLQDDTKTVQKFDKKLAKLEQDKRDTLKKKTGFTGTQLGGKAALEIATLFAAEPDKKWTLEDTAIFAAWKKDVNDIFADQIEELKYAASEAYEAALRKQLADYDIFMAIANDIGYDATGRLTKINELEEIGKALTSFINKVEEQA